MAVSEQDGPGSGEDGRIAHLYREASVGEPPARLDALIRAAARRAEPAGVTREPKAWWMPWRLPFAFAALAIVSASLVTLVVEEGGDRVSQVTVPYPPVQDEALSTRREDTQPAPAAKRSPGDQAQVQPTSPSPQGAAEVTRNSKPASAPGAAAPGPSAPPSAGVPEPPPAPPPPPAQAPLSKVAPAAKVERDQAAAQDALSRNSGGTAALEKANDAPFAESKTAPSEAMRERAPLRAAAPAPAAAPASVAAGRADRQEARGFQASPDIASLKAELESEPPAKWIERIVALRRDGRRNEADALLVEFKRRYPGEPLPSSLQ